MTTMTKPELLAPAGSLESFFAAMEKGADAVYAGLQEFSARARAKNFSLSQMERMMAYAHAEGKRIYVTLNTLVKEQELPQLVETLAALAGMRVDGVIVQDLAVARLVRTHFPSISLHASTQMTIHNTPGVKALEGLGFQRAVLARELAIDEIAAITAATPVEIEVFVHGALCFSISGAMFFFPRTWGDTAATAAAALSPAAGSTLIAVNRGTSSPPVIFRPSTCCRN